MFEPKAIDRIAPGENKEVQALVTPPDKAVAGDYAPPSRAASRGESASQPFRVAVSTSTMWGIVGAGIIGIALADHGRRGGEVRPAMSDTVIEAQGLTKRYGGATVGRRHLVHGSAGEIFGLLGPNGAGKTTTILMMLGLTEVTDGQVRVMGYDPVREPLQVKRLVGYLPDTVGFYDHLTAADNLRYTARPDRARSQASARRGFTPRSSVSGSCDVARQARRRPSRAACGSGSGLPKS